MSFKHYIAEIISFVIFLYTVKWKALGRKQPYTSLWRFVYPRFSTTDLGEFKYEYVDHCGTVNVSREIHTQVGRLKTSANHLFESWLTHLLNNQLTNQITNYMEQSLSSEANIPHSKNPLYFM